MKTQRPTKMVSNSDKPKSTKKVHRSAAKSSPRANGKNLLTTYEHAPVGIVECSPDGIHLRANEEFCRLLGYEKEELVGKGIKAITHEDDYPIDIKLHQQLVEGKIPFYRLEKRYIRKDGGILWVELTRSVVREASGTPLCTVGVMLDISERKHVERVLRDSSERLRLATEAARMFTWELDFKTQIYTLADNFEQVLGFSAGLMPKNSFETLLRLSPVEDVQTISEAIAKAIESHSDLHALQYRMINPENGQMTWLEANAKIVYNDDGTAERMTGVAQNITENKKAHEEILIISRMPAENPNPVMRLMLAGKILYANDASVPLLDSWKQQGNQMIPVELQKRVEEAFASGLKKEIEIEQNGKTFSCTLAPVREAGYVNLYANDITERKRAEEKLRASEALYRTIAHNIPGGGVYVVDKDMRYIVAEGSVTEDFGLSREILEGHTVSEVFRDAQRAKMVERLTRNFAGETLSYETEHNGRVYWTQQAPLFDSLGQAIIVTLDITERKRAEEALRQSEARFVQFMEHLPGLAWIKDMQGRYIYANASAEEAFNTPREKLYGKTDQEVFPLETAAQFKKNDEQALLDEKGIQVVETLPHDDGVLHYSLVSKFPIPGPDGKTALIGGTAFDITERLQANEALRESEERFHAILRQATAGIVRKDATGRLIFVNQAYCNLLGYTESELLGKPFWEFIHKDDVQENKRLYDRLMMEGVPFKLEKRLIREDGSILWVDVSVSPIMDATGKPQSAVAVEVDITRRKQAEEALQLLNLQLESQVLSRTEKLRAVNQSLRDEIAERKKVEMALSESRRRLQILSQRLVEVQEEERRAIARELHDRVGQSLSALNINLIIIRDQLSPDTLERVGPRLDDSMHLVGETITLVRDVMSNLRPAVLDDYGLEAALQSHMDEFTARYGIKVIFDRSAQPIPRLGPSIEMTFLRIAQEALINIVRHANASQVTLSLRLEGESVCMTIQDNGSGIVSWQEANRPGSHGLTIMRERAEAFGGNLNVASVPGKGTKVETSIPIGKGSQHEVQKETLE